MSPTEQLKDLANKVHLTIRNRYVNDIDSSEGQQFIDQVIDWGNMYFDELEFTTDSNGKIIDWWFLRQNGYSLGTAVSGEASIDLPTSVDRLLTDENRYVQILQDGTPVSNWAVVSIDNISNNPRRVPEDMCAVVGGNLVFSRQFRDTENNGLIVGDIVTQIPRLSRTNVKALSLIRPKLLITLGIAKNSTLPDILLGGLSPSYTQKYSDLINGAVARSIASSRGSEVQVADFGYIRGV